MGKPQDLLLDAVAKRVADLMSSSGLPFDNCFDAVIDGNKKLADQGVPGAKADIQKKVDTRMCKDDKCANVVSSPKPNVIQSAVAGQPRFVDAMMFKPPKDGMIQRIETANGPIYKKVGKGKMGILCDPKTSVGVVLDSESATCKPKETATPGTPNK
jgi:hypothetical protein